jgi:hypothetical protein
MGQTLAAGAIAHIALRPLLPTSLHPAHSRRDPAKECAMLRSTLPFTLFAIVAAGLVAGCNLDRPEVGDAIMPTAMATAPAAPQGQELFRMFDAEKQNAATAELPALF